MVQKLMGSFDVDAVLLACFSNFDSATLTVLLNLGLLLKSMKRIITNYGTVYLSNGYESHFVSLELLVKRNGGKLPSCLTSGSLEVIVW